MNIKYDKIINRDWEATNWQLYIFFLSANTQNMGD